MPEQVIRNKHVSVYQINLNATGTNTVQKIQESNPEQCHPYARSTVPIIICRSDPLWEKQQVLFCSTVYSAYSRHGEQNPIQWHNLTPRVKFLFIFLMCMSVSKTVIHTITCSSSTHSNRHNNGRISVGKDGSALSST